jgi:hypothetical protein
VPHHCAPSSSEPSANNRDPHSSRILQAHPTLRFPTGDAFVLGSGTGSSAPVPLPPMWASSPPPHFISRIHPVNKHLRGRAGKHQTRSASPRGPERPWRGRHRTTGNARTEHGGPSALLHGKAALHIYRFANGEEAGREGRTDGSAGDVRYVVGPLQEFGAGVRCRPPGDLYDAMEGSI